MRKVYIVMVLIASVFVLNACKKDSDLFIPDAGQVTGPDSTWYASINASMPVIDLQQSLLLAPDLDSIDVTNTADTLHSASGLQCIFPQNSCVDANGLPVNGKVLVESYLIKNRGGFISMGLPTISNSNLLVSGGAFSIKVKDKDAYIQLATNAVLNISYSDTAISKMQLFDGSVGNNGQFNWVQDTASNIFADNYGYAITSNQLHWINCDHFYGDTLNNDKTTLSITLPSHLTNANTLAYVVFNDMRSIMPMNGDAGSKQFITNKIPVGLNATIVTISKDGNFYYLGTEVIKTSAASATMLPILINPVRYSIDDIKYYLGSL